MDKIDVVEREFRAAVARMTGGIAPQDYGAAFWDWWLNLARAPDKQAELQQAAMQHVMDLWRFNVEAAQGKPMAPAENGDRRFSHPAWQQYPFNVWAQAFRANMALLEKSARDVPGVEPRNAALVEFAAKQAAESLSPANNPMTNPEVIAQTVAEGGQNLARGYKHFLDDMERTLHGGDAPGTEEFRVGEKVAVTEGQVIFRNELIELIQYAPTTPDVHPEPVLIVPAWIMKYYILDLSPHNSMARWFVAGAVGYANVDITPQVERDRDNRIVNITFEVNEGPQVFIERIDIVGNNRTLDRVIRREMRVAEGDAFNRVLLDRSRQRIQSLGFFEEVTVEEADGSQPDRSVVTVTVEEQSTGELAFAAGYSTSEAFLFDLSITERNLRGRGQFLRLRASASSQRQQVDLRFTEPRFLGRDLAAGFDIYSLRTDFLDQSSFENQSTGLGLRTSFPLSENSSLGVTYSLIQDDTEIANLLVDIDDSASNTVLVDQCGRWHARELVHG